MRGYLDGFAACGLVLPARTGGTTSQLRSRANLVRKRHRPSLYRARCPATPRASGSKTTGSRRLISWSRAWAEATRREITFRPGDGRQAPIASSPAMSRPKGRPDGWKSASTGSLTPPRRNRRSTTLPLSAPKVTPDDRHAASPGRPGYRAVRSRLEREEWTLYVSQGPFLIRVTAVSPAVSPSPT